MTTQDSTPDVPLKQCSKCKKILPATKEYFNSKSNRKDGLCPNCRVCSATARRERARAKGIKPKVTRRKDGLRKCAQCQKWFPDTGEFFPSKTSAYCFPCRRDYEREKRREQGVGPVPQRRKGDQKQCSHCERWFPATGEYFNKRSNSDDGLHYWCKECDIAYYHENKDRLRDNKKAADNRWREKNVEQIRTYKREWGQKYPDKVKRLRRVAANRRRARKENLPDTFTSDDFKRMMKYWHGCCAVCGRQLNDLFGERKAAMDHWTPIARGGPTTPDNILPLCHGIDGCNNSKSGKLPEEWLINKVGKRKAKQILERIRTYFEWVREQNNEPA